MGCIVKMWYNPYSCSSQILINGKPPSDYSSLVQYMNEPLYTWCEQLFDLLYNEINDDFSLIFTGRKLDADVLKILSADSKNCISFTHMSFITDVPLQKRMILLNDIIKKSSINVQKQKIDVDFIILDKIFDNYISKIEIRNRFCFVEKNVGSACNSRYAFILCSDFSTIDRTNAIFTFALKIGKKTGLVSYKNNVCYMETTQNDIFETIFNCFLFVPLCDAFYTCISSQSWSKNIAYTDGFRVLTAIKPLTKVELPDEIELNRSVPIKISTEPPTDSIPEIRFEYDKSGIVNCTNQRIEGLREGIVNILLYETGSNQAFAFKQVRVIKRNRITSLMLPENKFILGEGDTNNLTVNYFPENADNSDKIEWLSTNTVVATVSDNGRIRAISVGHCQIICSAENISARTEVEVRPYLKDIIIENITDEFVEITLDKDIELSLSLIPANAIDNSFKVISSNSLIVNTFGTTIHPVSVGEADVEIVNSSGRIKKSIRFNVVKKSKSKVDNRKKKSFWDIFKK